MVRATAANSAVNQTTLAGLVASNLICAVLAYLQAWSLHELLWIYWWQNIVIGFVNARRMLGLKSFSTEGFTSNGRQVPETEAGKRSTTTSFVIHYGIFHMAYLLYLVGERPLSQLPALGIAFVLAGMAAFTVAHVRAFARSQETEFAGRKPNLGTLMFYPYLRIVPMHLFIVAGSFWGAGQLLGFIALKVAADVAMQLVEDHLFHQQPGESERLSANRKHIFSRVKSKTSEA
jgi:hypothetical protein